MNICREIDHHEQFNEISIHYSDVIMGLMASQITGPTIIYSTVHSGADQRKHQSSASLAFVRGIHRWPVNSPHKGPVTRKMFLFDDAIMEKHRLSIKSLWPSDVISRHISGSTLVRVMVCCLKAPSHYTKQCWLTACVQRYSHEGDFTRITVTSPRGRWVKSSF